MNRKSSPAIRFPVGYYSFHKSQLFNFQLNRWHSLGLIPFEDIKNIGVKIHNFAEWKKVMVQLAENALSEKRLLNASFYYRAAEFYTFDQSGDKELFYKKFRDYFQEVFKKEQIKRFQIPYQSGYLPAMRMPPEENSMGTIVLHGGFDSFLEEWFFIMQYLADHGYEVIGFEGPGQGAALREYGLPFDIEWEKPVKAVLDYFNLSNVTLFGLSMGGWLGLRAAAFERGVKRVITSGHAIDYMKSYPYLIRLIHLWTFRQKLLKGFMNRMAIKKASADNAQGWMTRQLMYITRQNSPLEAFQVWLALNETNIHSERVTQDVLILSGSEDHFVPIRMHQRQIKALVNANSVTDRVFTRNEHAQNHCQIGNIKLLLDVIINWLKTKKPW